MSGNLAKKYAYHRLEKDEEVIKRLYEKDKDGNKPIYRMRSRYSGETVDAWLSEHDMARRLVLVYP